MARKRQYKKRQDYRKGGRVRYQEGGGMARNMAYTREDMLRDQARREAMTPAQKEEFDNLSKANRKTQEDLLKAQQEALAQAQANQGQRGQAPNALKEAAGNFVKQNVLGTKAQAEQAANQGLSEYALERRGMNPDGGVKKTLEDQLASGEAIKVNPETGQTFSNTLSADGTSATTPATTGPYTDPTQTQTIIDQNKIPDPEKVDTDIAMGTTTFDSDAQADAGPDVVATTVDAPEGVDAATYQAETVADQPVEVDAATGTRPDPIADIQGNLTAGVKYATSDELKVKGAEAKDADFAVTSGYLVDEVEGEDTTVADSPDAEKQTREAITGEPAPDGVASAIEGSVGYEAAKRREVKGTAAQGAAADMIAETAGLPPEISAAIVDDPAQVEAQIASEDVTVQAAVAALPTEALVSSQMENLLGGLESGTIPAWAKPAVSAVNQGLARRGLSVSTVGRDSLFNAIIQSALPMAQSNATALQTRAAQNLSNQQQANLAEATQEQQLRLQNLANRQTAASQTAQMSQQMKVMQSQFRQDAVMTTAQQQQQVRLQNLANRQQAAVVNTENQQQMNMANLSNEQQTEMANLQVEAERAGADQNAENQRRMAEMQVAADFLAKNAGFKQQMELANLTNDQQMRLANLSAQNQASADNLNAAQQTELANLNKNLQTNLLQGRIASEMNVAQLNVDQQRAITNANTVANMDMAKFNAKQQVELANSKFMQTVVLTDLSNEQQAIMQNATAQASMDLANLSVRERVAVENSKNFLAMDMANLNNQQQANMLKAQQTQQRLLSDQSAKNAARQFNASSENQVNQFMTNLGTQVELQNSAQKNAMEQFNKSKKVEVGKFNAQLQMQKDQWNAANRQMVEQSNVAWRRQSNTINTAAQNQVNMQNAQNAFSLKSSELSMIWQEARDKASFAFQAGEKDKDRKINVLLQSMAQEANATLVDNSVTNKLKEALGIYAVDKILN